MDGNAEAAYQTDASSLQATLENMDPQQTALAALQLQAIQSALAQAAGGDLSSEQAVVAALGDLQNSGGNADFYAQLNAAAAAVTASAAEHGVHAHAGHTGEALGASEFDAGDHGQAGGDKPLTSRYRGVCWNKKNRRWQAAINSSGKYIYLGSFVQEEEAARSFDRAALRLRGNRAKLNFSLSDYVDESGCLIEDPRLSAHLQNVLGKDTSKPAKANAAGPAAGPGGDGVMHVPGIHGSMMYGANLSQYVLTQGIKSPHCPYNGAQKHNYGVIDVPEGCSLAAHIPGDEDAFAVLYVGGTIPEGGAGAAVWDGSGAIDLGVFDTDKDARQAAGAVLKLAMFHRHLLTGAFAGGSMVPPDAAQASNAAITAAATAHYNLLMGAEGGAAVGGEGDPAIAAAVAAATAAASNDASAALAHTLGLGPGTAADQAAAKQFKEVFEWLAAYSNGTARSGKGEDGSSAADGNGEAAASHAVDAETLAGAEAMAAMVAAAGALKNDRDGGEGPDGEPGAKRLRGDDGLAQMKQLSGFKLQDVMASLFQPGHGA